MTVHELITKLKTFPKDVQVIYSYHSEYDILNSDDPLLVTAEEKKVILRNGRYMDAREAWYESGELQEWVTVVTLPGN